MSRALMLGIALTMGFAAATVPSPCLAAMTMAEETALTGEVVPFLFAPPMDTDLRYDIVITKTSTKETKILRLEQSIRFDRADNGYVMRIQTLRGSLPGVDAIALDWENNKDIPAFLRPLMSPVEVDIDINGGVIGMRDWPRLRNSIVAIAEPLSAYLEQDPVKRPAARKVADNISATFAKLSAADAAFVMLKGWPNVMGLAGQDFVLGQQYEIAGTLPAGMTPVAIPTRGIQVVERQADGLFHFSQKSRPDGAAMKAALAIFFDRSFEGLDPARRETLKAEFAKLEAMTVIDDIDIVLEPVTGLVRNARAIRETRIGDARGSETVEIFRVATRATYK